MVPSSSRGLPCACWADHAWHAGLVETSSNLASVRPAEGPEGSYSIVCCTRSSLGPALEAVRDRIVEVGQRVSDSLPARCGLAARPLPGL